MRNVTARSAAGWIGGTLAKLCEVQDGRREELKAGLGAIGRAVLEMLCGATYITLAPGTRTLSPSFPCALHPPLLVLLQGLGMGLQAPTSSSETFT